MKRIITAILLFGVSVLSFAQSSTTGSVSSTTSTSSTGTATNAGNAQNINFLSGGNSTETLHTTPTVYVGSPANSISNFNCMVIPTAGFSVMNFGMSGSVPIDGTHCDWRQNTVMAQQQAGNFTNLARAPELPADVKNEAAKSAITFLSLATNMQCLNSDRQRAVMEKLGMCTDVSGIATLDHRFNQPRNYQVDYSGQSK